MAKTHPETIPGEIMESLRTVSTATLTTALFKRGFRNTYIQGIRLLNRSAPRMVGPAFTLRYIPAREDIDHLGVFQDPDHPQRRGVEELPAGHVMVVDSRKDGRAASAGGILLTRLMMRGAAGFVTDGGLRDTPDIRELALPAYCAGAAAPTNLIHHHAVDLNVPIACGDVPIYPGDLMVGDEEGVVAIPRHVVADVTEEAVEMTAFEGWVEDRVKEGRSIIGLYPPSGDSRREYERFRHQADRT